MKVFTEISLDNFDAWSGAIETKERIIEEGKSEEFEQLIDELFPEGIDETSLNNILWFEDESIFEHLGITNEDEEND